MIVVGFLLLVLTAVAVVIAIYAGGKQAQFDLGFVDIDVVSSSWFFAGMVTTLVGVIGLGLMKRGLRVSRERRKELKKLEKMRGEIDQMRRTEHERDAQAAEKAPEGDRTV